MALLAEYVFTPLDGKRDELVDQLDGLFACLSQNGQIWGGTVAGWVDGQRRVVCGIPRRDSLDERYASQSVRDELGRIVTLCEAAPTWRVVDERPGSTRDWRDESALYLFTHLFDKTSPVCAGADGNPVPLYLLPIDEESRQNLTWWCDQWRRFDHLWLDCGQFEVDAYRQLADLSSECAKEGRELATVVERATGRPTYYYLMKYWGRDLGNATRPCPGCGAPWRNPDDGGGKKGVASFEFRCEPCRLISNIPPSIEGDRHPGIGEWPGRRLV